MTQRDAAMITAWRLLRLLPDGAVFSFTLTDETPAVFNIFVKNETERVRYRSLLHLERHAFKEEDDTYETYLWDNLAVSIIEEGNLDEPSSTTRRQG